MTFAFIHQLGVVKDGRKPEGAWLTGGEHSGLLSLERPRWQTHSMVPVARRGATLREGERRLRQERSGKG